MRIWRGQRSSDGAAPSPEVVCANGHPAHVLAPGDGFTLVRYLADNGDGPGTSIRNDLIQPCTCDRQGGCR
ncbi:hypothetical protein ACQP10_38070 (plasmid) [Streptosporangium sandarakinum]|uniref:hypothetical protein n=1 Tax=Streptosporangium sandarakinum TaxID=1260955 RepID=UPI003D8FEEE3